MKHKNIFDAITNFENVYKYHKFNDPKNHNAYMELVSMCIDAGLIPECNKYEFSTHGRLTAAITYIDNRESFCN